MKKILIVDDEVQILHALSRIFFETDYEVLTAESGDSALSILESTEVDLIISDMRMPLMDGYALLSRVKDKYPNTIRIILSGYSDDSTIFKAVLHNVAKFYILKPWDNNKLLAYIHQIFQTEDLLRSKDLLTLINKIEKVPTIEASYQRILNMIARDEEIRFISSEIEKDFAISTKLLQVANSAYYGLQTGSVKRACVYLGLQNLKSLVYSISIMDSINKVPEGGRQRVKLFWDHAVMSNNILNYIYEFFLNKRLPDSASSAGLLHNIGILILIQNFYKDYMGYLNNAKEESVKLLEMEREVFKVTHQEAGGYLVSWWELPFPIAEAALFHHRPLDPNVINRELVCGVHLAQYYAWLKMKEPIITKFYPEVFDILGISREEFEKSIEQNSFR